MLYFLKGANINSKTKDQYTPLLLASSKGHTDTVQFLVKNGAQMAEADFSNKTVLHVAVESGYYPVILALLKEVCKTHVCIHISFQSFDFEHPRNALCALNLIFTFLLMCTCWFNITFY
jgi:ankyrin repeat protein